MASQWAQYLWREIKPHISPCADFSYVVQFFWFTNAWKWAGVYFTATNVQFEDVSFIIKASDEEKFLLFQNGETNGKLAMCLIGMLDAGMWINDNIDPNWANEVCKWGVTVTTCSLPYIGKSTKFDYVRKISTWGGMWFKSSAIISRQSIWSIRVTANLQHLKWALCALEVPKNYQWPQVTYRSEKMFHIKI